MQVQIRNLPGGFIMEELIFSGNAQVRFQGADLFSYLTISQSRLRFQWRGVDGERVTVLDHRPVSLNTVRGVMEDPGLAPFLRHFNAPARVTIKRTEEWELRVDLYDTYDSDPIYYLWVASLEDQVIPFNQRLFHKTCPVENGQVIVLDMFERYESHILLKWPEVENLVVRF
jgi:hypothetical protein